MKPSERNIGLDMFRSIAVWNVLIIHIAGIFYIIGISPLIWLPIPDGVDLFFVLSGYLIGRILIKNFVLADSFSKKDILKFLIQRWLRTLPNYYFLTFIVIGLTILASRHLFFPTRNLLFLQNVYTEKFHYYPETWSLCVEEWFYVIFPFCILLFFLFGKQRLTKQNFIFITSAIIIITTIARLFYGNDFMQLPPSFWLDYREITFIRLDAIAYGTLAAYISIFHNEFWKRYKNALFIVGAILLVMNTILIFIIINGYVLSDNIFLSNHNFSLNSIGILLMLSKIETIAIKNKYLIRLFTFTSKISYSMYLIQLSLLLKITVVIFMALKLNVHKFMHITIFLVLYIILVYLISGLNYKYVELYFLKLRDKITNKYF